MDIFLSITFVKVLKLLKELGCKSSDGQSNHYSILNEFLQWVKREWGTQNDQSYPIFWLTGYFSIKLFNVTSWLTEKTISTVNMLNPRYDINLLLSEAAHCTFYSIRQVRKEMLKSGYGLLMFSKSFTSLKSKAWFQKWSKPSWNTKPLWSESRHECKAQLFWSHILLAGGQHTYDWTEINELVHAIP